MYDNSKAIAKWYADGGDDKIRYNYPLNQDSIVVDIGGYQGHFADVMFKRFSCKVHVFEPIKGYYLQCSKLHKGNPKVEVYPFGICGHGEGLVDISIEDDASSIFKAKSASHVTQIYLKPISHLFTEDRMNLPFVHLLKLNVEGAEYDILHAMVTEGWIKRTQYLQVQFHDFVPDAITKREALHKKLSETHNLMWDYPFVWESWQLKQ